jgi:hypothetical protein
MKVAVSFSLTGVQRVEIAGFLGRRGDVATIEECRAFLKSAAERALATLPPSCAPINPPADQTAPETAHDWADKHDPRMRDRWPALAGSTPEGMYLCLRCGYIKRRDGKNAPCKGVMPRVELRGGAVNGDARHE